MQRVPVVSSNVVSVGYEQEDKSLFVEYRGGSVYKYEAVPLEYYRALMESPSKGRWVRSQLVGKFKATRIL